MKAVVALLFLALTSVVLATSESEYQSAFTSWMHAHKKMYSSDMFFQRYNAFKTNYDFVAQHDAEAEGFEVELNFLADLSVVEFSRIYNGYRMKAVNKKALHANALLDAKAEPFTDAVDWRTQGYVTPIKNQGQCGSCWSFSTTGSTEGANFKKNGTLVSFSEQQLVDCSGSYGNQGCNGGLMDDAFKYIEATGITTEDAYPYTSGGGQTGTCQLSGKPIEGHVTSYIDVPTGSETVLTTAIQTIGPISVAIDASHISFQLYKTGVYYEKACSTTSLDHGVLAVGYGTDAEKGDYYIVKNSWGTVWGMEGYINMSRNKNNNCGIATAASYPIDA